MTLAPPYPSLYPEVRFPGDAGLPSLPKLFDAEWVWETHRHHLGTEESEPASIRIRQFSHSPGRSAIVGYEVVWDSDTLIPSQHFAVRIGQDNAMEVFGYPEDPSLPGLKEAAEPESALRLLNRHVLRISARRAHVELVRYRPTSRAVLRHGVGRVRFYARVVRKDGLATLLRAHELVAQSPFVAPRLAGHWAEGGVLWLSELPGRNLRRRIRQGKPPNPNALLDGLESLWNTPIGSEVPRPFDLDGTYERAKRTFRQNVRDDIAALHAIDDATTMLDPFVRSWKPSGIAHNDFYDDQMVELPDGRIGLVDFEEAGPGDPMLDVGNFLGHLRWSSHFGRKTEASASAAYHQEFRSAALDRFRWNASELALREAVCLFRVCTNAIRHPQQDWQSKLQSGLGVVNGILG